MGLTGVRRIAALTVLAAALVGCAPGSPSPTAPEESDTVAPAATVAVEAEGPTPTPVMLSDAPTSVPSAAALSPVPALRPATVEPAVTDAESDQSSISSPAALSEASGDAVAERVDYAQAAPSTADLAAAAPAPAIAAAEQSVAAKDPNAGQPAAAPPAQATDRPSAPPPPTDGQSLLVEGGSNDRKEVALTFDAGADVGYTGAILDLLRDEGIQASFGMTGAFAEEHPDLVQRMVIEGHQLINHTWSHTSMTGVNGDLPPMTYEQLADELARTEQVVRDETGYELKPYFRPPYGDYDGETLQWLDALGYPFTIMWTCDTQGWRGWGADRILDYCTQVPLEDEIVLMHVGAAAAGDYEVLPLLIDYYRQRDYAFVTVEQMLQP